MTSLQGEDCYPNSTDGELSVIERGKKARSVHRTKAATIGWCCLGDGVELEGA